MPNDSNNTNGYSSKNADEERDMGAKGGPTTSLGTPDNKHSVAHPYDADIQTQLAAKSTENKKETDKLSTEKGNN